MKKIMIMFAAVAMAISAQAAAASWQVSISNVYDGNGGSSAKWSGSGYIYAYSLGTMTQQAIFDTFVAGGDISEDAIATITCTSGTVSPTANKFEYGEQGGGRYSYFVALVNGDNILLTKTVSQTANSTATAKTLGYGTLTPTTGVSSMDLPARSMTIGGWATAASAPEPTSGLLLLLGMAGLALKRKQA